MPWTELTFANFAPADPRGNDVYDIGTTEEHPQGVAREMASAFGYELASPYPEVDNLGGLIQRVGRSKELRDNIGRVQEVLGTSDDAITIARGWAERSGLLLPVERLYATAEPAEGVIDMAIITGGVRNWMQRRASRLVELAQQRPVAGVLLVAGNREMKPDEGEDVEAGMTEADYMGSVIASRLAELGLLSEVLRVDSGVGDEVMRAAANRANVLMGLVGDRRVAVISNAGAWVQNAGQFLRAGKASTGGAFDIWGDQLEVASDTFPLGVTGDEPAAEYQNPFSAAGQIARNLQEFERHAPPGNVYYA